MIETFYDKSATITRLQDDESGDTESYGYHLIDVPCHVQALDDYFSQDIDGHAGKEWIMVCAIEDIKEGDHATIDEKEYDIVGVKTLEFDDPDDHMELRIRLGNP
jgi:hypothetical protein